MAVAPEPQGAHSVAAPRQVSTVPGSLERSLLKYSSPSQACCSVSRECIPAGLDAQASLGRWATTVSSHTAAV